jgi:hypothetical protein
MSKSLVGSHYGATELGTLRLEHDSTASRRAQRL